jgi:arylsulfatase A-like enzyme
LQAPAAYIERFSEVDDIYRRYYSAMVSNMDDNIGRVLDILKETGQMENTIIWFISDNGGYTEQYFGHADNGRLRGEKGQIFEGGIRIPATVCWEGRIGPGQVISQPAVNIDVLPTLLDILSSGHENTNMNFDGISLVPVLMNNVNIERDIFWQYRNQRALRRGDWKLYEDELYNLKDDIGEQNDLAGTNMEIFNDLLKAHEEYMNSMQN